MAEIDLHSTSKTGNQGGRATCKHKAPRYQGADVARARQVPGRSMNQGTKVPRRSRDQRLPEARPLNGPGRAGKQAREDSKPAKAPMCRGIAGTQVNAPPGMLGSSGTNPVVRSRNQATAINPGASDPDRAGQGGHAGPGRRSVARPGGRQFYPPRVSPSGLRNSGPSGRGSCRLPWTQRRSAQQAGGNQPRVKP